MKCGFVVINDHVVVNVSLWPQTYWQPSPQLSGLLLINFDLIRYIMLIYVLLILFILYQLELLSWRFGSMLIRTVFTTCKVVYGCYLIGQMILLLETSGAGFLPRNIADMFIKLVQQVQSDYNGVVCMVGTGCLPSFITALVSY